MVEKYILSLRYYIHTQLLMIYDITTHLLVRRT